MALAVARYAYAHYPDGRYSISLYHIFAFATIVSRVDMARCSRTTGDWGAGWYLHGCLCCCVPHVHRWSLVSQAHHQRSLFAGVFLFVYKWTGGGVGTAGAGGRATARDRPYYTRPS